MSTWKRMYGFDEHFINEDGNIFSLKSGKILKKTITGNGYECINLYNNKEFSNRFVHRLLMQTFVGYDERQVNHKDGNKLNNCLSNLEYMTQSENQNHAVATGLRKLKYTREQVDKIKSMKSIHTQSDISKILNVPIHFVKDVQQGRTRLVF